MTIALPGGGGGQYYPEGLCTLDTSTVVCHVNCYGIRVQCLHDMTRPRRSGTCRQSSLVPFIPG